MRQKSTLFWNVTQSMLVEVCYSFWGTCFPHLQDQRISQGRRQCEASSMYSQSRGCYLLPAAFLHGFFFNLKMEAMCSSKILVDFQWTAWHYIPEDNHCSENVKSYFLELSTFIRFLLNIASLKSVSLPQKSYLHEKAFPRNWKYPCWSTGPYSINLCHSAYCGDPPPPSLTWIIKIFL